MMKKLFQPIENKCKEKVPNGQECTKTFLTKFTDSIKLDDSNDEKHPGNERLTRKEMKRSPSPLKPKI